MHYEESFQEIKKKLASAPILIFLNQSESLVVYCDASKTGSERCVDAEWSSCGLCFEITESS